MKYQDKRGVESSKSSSTSFSYDRPIFAPIQIAKMSLHRVSSMSSYEQVVRGPSPARSEHKNMSFNPVGNGKAPAGQDEPVGAFDVSKIKRLCQYSLSWEV